MTTVPDSGAVVAPEPPAHGPRRRPRPCWPPRSRRWAWSTATSAPARSTRSRSASRRNTASPPPRPTCWACCRSSSGRSTSSCRSSTSPSSCEADNRGEGGIMALLALLQPRRRRGGVRPVLIGHRPVRRGAALRRRRHHAGDLGPRRGRGHRASRRRSCPPWVVPIVSSVILVALFMFQRRGTARVGAVFGRVMVVWFASIALLGVRRDPAPSGGAGRRQSVARDRFLPARRPAGLSHPGRRRAGRDRRRGALRRHGPFRQAPDPARLVRRGVAGAGAQLLRPGRAPARSTVGGRESVLLARAGLGPVSDGRASPRRPRWWRRRR